MKRQDGRAFNFRQFISGAIGGWVSERRRPSNKFAADETTINACFDPMRLGQGCFTFLTRKLEKFTNSNLQKIWWIISKEQLLLKCWETLAYVGKWPLRTARIFTSPRVGWALRSRNHQFREYLHKCSFLLIIKINGVYVVISFFPSSSTRAVLLGGRAILIKSRQQISFARYFFCLLSAPR